MTDYTHTFTDKLRATHAFPPSLLSGCVLYLPMDEGTGNTTNDASGNNNNGTITGASWVAGKYGDALSFDGTDDYVGCGNGAPLSFGTGSFAISVWVKASYTGAIQILIQKQNVVGNSIGYSLYLKPINPYVRIYVSDGTNFVYNDSEAIDPRDGAWHHIVGVYNPTVANGTIYIYIDGTLRASQASTYVLNTINNSLPLELGRNYDNGNPIYWLNGSLDEVRIYNRVLSQAEVTYLYNSTQSRIMSKYRTLISNLANKNYIGSPRSRIRRFVSNLSNKDTKNRVSTKVRTLRDHIGGLSSYTKGAMNRIRILSNKLGVKDTLTHSKSIVRIFFDKMGCKDSQIITLTFHIVHLFINKLGIKSRYWRSVTPIRKWKEHPRIKIQKEDED